MKKIKKEWIFLLCVIVLAGTVLGYGYLNNRTKERLYLYEQIEKNTKKSALENCTQNVWKNYSLDWDGACALIGREDDCSLPGATADKLNKLRQIEIENCIEYNK